MLSHNMQAVRADLEARAGYSLSDNQVQFAHDVLNQGFEIDFKYSGRGMFGRRCPAVIIDDISDFSTEASTVSDQMGLGWVIYAQY